MGRNGQAESLTVQALEMQQRLALQETLAHCQSLAVEGRLRKDVSRKLVTWKAA